MGVRGLSTFIDNNQQLLSHHRLHGTKVVIDGNNLYHFLFYSCHVSHQFGGDYDHYARKIKHFFNTLKLCNVTPYVVFDGGYDPDDRKLPTILKRVRDRRETVSLLCSTGRGKILPILAHETFRQVLVELDVAHVSSDFEADDQIAVLANDLGCPVMSNDSDFFVFSINGGYVPFDYINLTLCVFNTETEEECVLTTNMIVKETEFVYIPAKYYHYTRFTECMDGKDMPLLPLLATLLGNDFVDAAVFEKFFTKLSVPRNACKNFVVQCHTKMHALLHWLQSLEDINRGVDRVVETLPKGKKEDVRNIISKSLDSYSGKQGYTSINLKEYFNELMISDRHQSRSLDLTDYYGNQLSEWFVARLRQCEISTFLQNTAVLHRVILLCQIEVLSAPTTYRCCEDIRQVIYGIIIKSAPQSTVYSRETCVEEYDRDVKNTKKFYVAPIDELEKYGKLPSIETMPDIDEEKRQQILVNALGVDFNDVKDKNISVDLMVLLCTVVYCVRNASPRISVSHVRSLLLCVLMLHVRVLDWLGQKQEREEAAVEPYLYQDISLAYRTSRKKLLEHIEKHLDKYLQKPDHSAKHPRENMVVHGFSQFQACLLDMVHLNQLLMYPISPPSPSVIFNGTFMYNLCRDLQGRVNPGMFVAELLSNGSPLHQIFSQLECFILKLCPENCFIDNRRTAKKKTKKLKKESRPKSGSSPSDMQNAESSKTACVAVNCSVNNRFALLDLSE